MPELTWALLVTVGVIVVLLWVIVRLLAKRRS
jgi:hypothetical protein